MTTALSRRLKAELAEVDTSSEWRDDEYPEDNDPRPATTRTLSTALPL